MHAHGNLGHRICRRITDYTIPYQYNSNVFTSEVTGQPNSIIPPSLSPVVVSIVTENTATIIIENIIL